MIKVVDGFENYQISDEGFVIGPRGKVLKPDEKSNGYLRVSLSKGGKVTRFFIHRLVAMNFMDSVEGSNVINHKNGDRKDNRTSNLEWTTQQGNVQDGYDRGRILNNTPISPEKEKEVLGLIDSGFSRLKTSRKTGVSVMAINRIIRDYR